MVGYSGSRDPPPDKNPSYENIGTFAESIRIRYDPAILTYLDILEMFFAFHTPAPETFTGTQYRSAIFYHSEDQRLAAEELVGKMGLGRYVSVEPSRQFFAAEEYHQKYLEKAMQLH